MRVTKAAWLAVRMAEFVPAKPIFQHALGYASISLLTGEAIYFTLRYVGHKPPRLR